MKKTYITILGVLLVGNNFAQNAAFYINGAKFINQQDSFIVKAGTGNSGDFVIQNADSFSNKGNIFIERNFQNEAIHSLGKTTNSGNFIVFQDWINNNPWQADVSKVYLRGNAQNIKGTTITTFHDLIAENSGTVKTQDIDANVDGTLTLNHNELATQGNKMTILNPQTGAIVVNGINDAFVSSTGNGRLARHTNSTGAYLFPTGWNNAGTAFKREVTIAPIAATTEMYNARLGFNTLSQTSTTDDGYNISTKDAAVQNVNDKFYHLLSAQNNSTADLFVHYDPTSDGSWESVGRWQGTKQWEDLSNSSMVAGSPRSQMRRAAWLPTANEPHALVNPISSKKDYDFPNAFVPGSTTSHSENTYFTIINQSGKVILDELSVFDRWGEMVFNSKRDGTNSWDGMYQGKLQQQGNYVYMATIRSVATNTVLPKVSGNLSLLW